MDNINKHSFFKYLLLFLSFKNHPTKSKTIQVEPIAYSLVKTNNRRVKKLEYTAFYFQAPQLQSCKKPIIPMT